MLFASHQVQHRLRGSCKWLNSTVSASGTLQLILLPLLFQLLLLPNMVTSQGLQSGGSASSTSFLPTGAYYHVPSDSTDSESDDAPLLYITGYEGSTCYLTQLDVRTMTVLEQVVLPNTGTCTGVSRVAPNQFVLAGYTSLGITNQTVAALQVRIVFNEINATTTTQSSLFFDGNSTAVYPVAIVADETDTDTEPQRVFSVAVDTASDTASTTLNYAESDYRLTVQRVTNTPTTGRVEMFRVAYFTTRNGVRVPLIPSDLVLMNNDQLIVVGSSLGGGGGQVFGSPADINDVSEDGFVVKFDARSGVTTSSAPQSTRLASSGAQDDVVHAVCSSSPDDAYVYVVGTTAGIMDESLAEMPGSGTHAFVAKIEVATLTVAWIKQWGAVDASASVEGHKCAVYAATTGDADTVYVAGTVSADAALAGNAAVGGQDVYVAQISATDGHVWAVTQLGSDQEDSVADIVTTVDGNAILIASTQGTWLGPSTGTVDWVVTEVMYQQQQDSTTPVEDDTSTTTTTTTTTVTNSSTTTTSSTSAPLDDATTTAPPEVDPTDAGPSTNNTTEVGDEIQPTAPSVSSPLPTAAPIGTSTGSSSPAPSALRGSVGDNNNNTMAPTTDTDTDTNSSSGNNRTTTPTTPPLPTSDNTSEVGSDGPGSNGTLSSISTSAAASTRAVMMLLTWVGVVTLAL